MIETKLYKISDIKPNPNNPRIIKDDKFLKLVNSIKEFPEMLKIRPIVINEDNVVLGGNMRLKACKEAKLKEIPVIKASDLTEAQQKEFIIKDNVGFGEWDFHDLAQNWNADELLTWGLDLPSVDEDDSEEFYSTKIQSPIYQIKGEKPKVNDLFDLKKYNELIEQIEKSNIQESEKEFLKIAAQRHIVFNYSKIAEFYAHSDIDTQELMENSALIIIDYERAIENGFVSLYNSLNEISLIDE